MKIVKSKGKFREKCGNCYYNGNCFLQLKECFFIKNERKTKV